MEDSLRSVIIDEAGGRSHVEKQRRLPSLMGPDGGNSRRRLRGKIHLALDE